MVYRECEFTSYHLDFVTLRPDLPDGGRKSDQKELNEVVLPFFSLCHMVVMLWGEKRIYA